MKFLSPIFPLLTLSLLFLLFPISAQAIQILPGCAISGDGGVCCALASISNLARWILGIVGAAALFFFVYGGFLWITSAGVSSRVQKGQGIMINTVIGIIIVVLAWTAVNFIITSFVDKKGEFKFVGKSNAEWYQLCAGEKGKECEYQSDGSPCNNRAEHCEAGKCLPPTACDWLATVKKDPNYAGWGCHALVECKLNNYNDCDSDPNCEQNLCPEGINNVCCKP